MAESYDPFKTQLACCAADAFTVAKQQELFIVERFVKYQLSRQNLVLQLTRQTIFDLLMQLNTFTCVVINFLL